MKDLKEYITERISGHVNERIKDTYLYHPKTKDELKEAIKAEINVQGMNADLNCIDTSAITDMGHLFQFSEFNGDISNWDTSKVTNMCMMFYESKFNGDIKHWDTSNVRDMYLMFTNSPLARKKPKWYRK